MPSTNHVCTAKHTQNYPFQKPCPPHKHSPVHRRKKSTKRTTKPTQSDRIGSINETPEDATQRRNLSLTMMQPGWDHQHDNNKPLFTRARGRRSSRLTCPGKSGRSRQPWKRRSDRDPGTRHPRQGRRPWYPRYRQRRRSWHPRTRHAYGGRGVVQGTIGSSTSARGGTTMSQEPEQ